jgi:Kef-type K+ transport system membrane component KefB/mannitol/fructose-specific phosphotransferase system IIA component
MESLSHSQITTMFLALAVLLATARLFGEIAKAFRQPAVLGEILAGILLGPTVLGHLWPEANQFLFPMEGPNAIALTSLTTLAVVLFLLVAGMELDLSMLFRLKKPAAIIGLCGLATPFAMGFGLGQLIPGFLGMEAGADRLVFSLFLGVALAVSALPVIAKTLMDLNLYRSDVGMTIIAVAIFHDLVGWVIFAIILGMMNPDGGAVHGGVGVTIGLTLAFVAVMLTVGRWAIHHTLPWLQAHTSWPGGVLGFALALGLFGAAFTEWIGIHAIFGAFIVGIALGDSEHLRQQTRTTIDQFISFIFAPLFFASISLRVDFVTHFDWLLVLTVLVIACVGETVGCAVGALWSGFPKRQSWAIGFALNARGAMEIVLALLALQYGVIGERLFVALVVMALVTSLIAGPLMQFVLRRKQPAQFRRYLSGKTFLPGLAIRDRKAVIDALAAAAEPIANIHGGFLAERVWGREQTMSTALPGGLAVPHARVPGLERPVVAVGLIPAGVDWDAGDGKPTRLVILVLTPVDADEMQLELLADIAATFQQPEAVSRAVNCDGYTRFLALLNAEGAPANEAVAPEHA